eukprot:123346-Chlamydomonas_euryale.AAC.1
MSPSGATFPLAHLDVAQRRNVAVHRKDSVGHDQLDASAGIACRNELPLQVCTHGRHKSEELWQKRAGGGGRDDQRSLLKED